MSSIIVMLLVMLDQVTKFLVNFRLASNHEVEVINGWFYLANVRNRGAAWGILQNGRVLFIVVTLLAMYIMLYLIRSTCKNYVKVALMLVLGGSMGNFIDRVMRGYVIDFLDCYIFGYHFPTFNMADIFITIGVILLLYCILLDKDFQNIGKEREV
ncbi:MAG: signal peptidase II [Clostridiales bacterium]|nr:signal peptidase II [Clostridiales bacterium]